MGYTASTEPQCLYRASVPVQSLSACTEPQCQYRASVPVQSLSASTEPQGLYRASVPVQSLSASTEPQCLYRASVPVQSLSACTRVHFTFFLFTFLDKFVLDVTVRNHHICCGSVNIFKQSFCFRCYRSQPLNNR